jgi:hypothetical protein
MRQFIVTVMDKELEELVVFAALDRDTNSVIVVEVHYHSDYGIGKDEAYTEGKKALANAIRHRVASEVLAVPDCHTCRSGRIASDSTECSDPQCADYIDAVALIGDIVNISVAYSPGDHHDTDFPL